IDSTDNLFVPDWCTGDIHKFTPLGVESTFVSGSNHATGSFLAFQPTTFAQVAECTTTPTPTPTPVARAVVADFNGDSSPDFVLEQTSLHETVVGYLNNNVVIGAGFGPTLPAGWRLAGAADFDGDGQTDYVLFNPGTGQTLIGYMSGLTAIGAAYGPSVPLGWELVAA